MAYDPVHNQMVLFGGNTAAGAATNQTWIWQYNIWTLASPATSPSARTGVQLAWDPGLGKVLMFGGCQSNGTGCQNDTWTWDGTTWVQLTPTAPPAGRDLAGFTWDPDYSSMVLFGGQTSTNVYNDTWMLTGTTWTQIQANGTANAPAFRFAAGMAYSTSTKQLILFGGAEHSCTTCVTSGTYGNDTWLFGSTGWSPVSTTSAPAGRAEMGMAYDPGLGGILLVDGGNATTLFADTWAWNGTTWVQAQTGTTQAPWNTAPSLAITDSGQAVWEVASSDGSTGNTWTYDTGIPVMSSAVVSPPSGQSAYFPGDTATINISAQNTSTNAITPTIQVNLPSDLAGMGTDFAWGPYGSQSPVPHCSATLLGNCGNSVTNIPTFTTVALGSGAQAFGTVVAQVVGNTRGCELVTVPVTGTDIYGGISTTRSQAPVCGGGLGSEKWWTYDTTQLGVGGTAAVNAANGNLLLKQTDTAPVQSHGQLAFELGRAYNSQDNMNPNLLSQSPLGAGWQWDTSTVGGDLSGGLDVGSLLTPKWTSLPQGLQSTLQPLSVTYVDRDGTRDVFTWRGTTVQVASATLLLGLAPNLKLNGNNDALCADATYQAPAGVDMYLYRYLDVAGNCGPGSSGSLLGWAVVRPNRERYDYNALGQLVDVTDASGNQLIYNNLGNQLMSITTNRCPGGGTCPSYNFNYTSFTVGSAGYNRIDVTDPAGRVTSYVVAQAQAQTQTTPGIPAELQQVWNPDNPFSTSSGAVPSIVYTYSTPGTGGVCPGSPTTTTTVGALCSVTDPASRKTTFAYTPAALGPDRILSVTDRRANVQNSTTGSETVYHYTTASDGYSVATVTADTAAPATLGSAPALAGCTTNASCERNNYTGIDQWGRVGEVDQGNPTSGTTGNWLHQEAFFWDANIIVNGQNYGCVQPYVVRDNQLCETITRTAPSLTSFTPLVFGGPVAGVSANDHVAVYEYNELGMPTKVGHLIDPTVGITPSNLLFTTYGNHLQYVESGSQAVSLFDDRVYGGGNVDYQTDANPNSYSSTVVHDGATAFYKFDNLSGLTATDSATPPPNNQDATEDPSGVLGQPGPNNRPAVGEGGANHWAGSVGALSHFANGAGNSSAFTIEAWVNTTNTGADYTVCSPCGTSGLIAGRTAGGYAQLYLIGDPTHQLRIQGGTNLATGTWHQVVYTYDGSGNAANAHIYVDGKLDSNAPPAQNSLGTVSFRPDASLALFGDNTTATAPDGTDLADLSLYNTALGADKVLAHYQAMSQLQRPDPGTLYAVGDQTEMLTPRGNNAAKWGNYLTTYRRDVPATVGSNYPQINTASGTICAGSPQNTGLLCETDTPASAGVAAGSCQNPITAGGGAPGGGSTDGSDAYTCSRYDYYGTGSATGQRKDMWAPSANAQGAPSGSQTSYTYYQDVADCSNAGAAGGGTNRDNCDLSGNVSAGGWLETVTDASGNSTTPGKSVAYAYDRAGNIARTWDRNATGPAVSAYNSAHNNSTLTATSPGFPWADPAAVTYTAFTETDHTNPVTSNDLSVSAYDTEIITPQGLVVGSGDNAAGQLGNNSTTNAAAAENTSGPKWDSTSTVALGGLHDVVQIAQSGQGGFNSTKSTFALTGSGIAYGWGQLASSTIPVAINGPGSNLPPFTAISVGTAHVLALDRSGVLWAWGQSTYGQVGNGSTSGNVTTPVAVMSGVASFSAGGYHSLAVKTDGTVWAWGWNGQGQLGNNSTTNSLSPTQVPNFGGVASVSGGVENSYAIKADGTVWAWGDNSQGDLGTGSAAATSLVPAQITSLGAGPGTGTSHGRVRQIAGSVWGAAALLADGTVWAWGLNNAGQLGGAVSGNYGVPVQIPNLSNQVALAGGWATYLSADETGTINIWGGTNSGQMGNGSTPAQVLAQPVGTQFNTGAAPLDNGSSTGLEQAASPFAAPWRYVAAGRDQLGNRSTITYDADGMPTATRPARGNDVFSTTYDTYNSYDAGNNLTQSQTPVERGGAGGLLGSPGNPPPAVARPTTFTYDAYGNKTVAVDPRGFATVTDYDLLNRAVDVKTTRPSSAYSGTTCANSPTGSGWTAAQAGHMMCTTFTAYDGNDQVTSTTDANAQTSYFGFNALGQKVTQTVPRNQGAYTNLTSVTAYDADGNVTDVCPPRQFDTTPSPLPPLTTTAGSCPANAAYGTHKTYDHAGRVTGVTVYRIDSSGHAQPGTTSVGFDADGNTLATTNANGFTTTYSYDRLDRKQSMSVPRAAGVSYTTTWSYDPSGDVTKVTTPSTSSYGDGVNGALVVDGSTNPQSNPYVVPNGARYTNVTLQNGGWISGQSAGSATGASGLVFTATGTVTVCSNCGITQAGNGQLGGAGSNQILGNNPGSPGQVIGGNGGGPGTGSTNGGGGGGGGHNGPGTAGVGGALLQGNGGAGGLTSGTSSFSDVGSNYALGSGGGGGGAGQGLNTAASAAGGNGGGFIHVSAPTMTINGTVTAAGANGAYTANVNGGSGGGAGGGIWLTGDTINLSSAGDLNVNGGTGGPNASSGGPGGAGAPGYIRLDGNVTNAPSSANRTSAGSVTAYSYDADHRLIDTVAGFQGTSANVADDAGNDAIPDTAGQTNERTRIGYDAGGAKVIVFNPRAFTDTASLTKPNLDYAARTDLDADGRPIATYAPRYDTANPDNADVVSGGDGGTSTDQQTSQCPTGADPSVAPGYGTYPNTTGVCVTRTAYNEDGNVSRQYLPTSTGSDNRYQQITYTDDGLKSSISTPDPQNDGSRTNAATNKYDADGRLVQATDANNNTTVTDYTADGLVYETDGPATGSTSHIMKYTFDANGDQITASQPNYNSPGFKFPSTTTKYAAGDYVTTTGWTSDGLKAQVAAPGVDDNSFNVTNYTYDSVGNPATVQAPQATATSGAPEKFTYTYDNLILTSQNPITASSFRVTNYAYTPSGQKASSDVGTCTTSDMSQCNSGNSGTGSPWKEGETLRYGYAPDGLNTTQIGRDNASFGPSSASITTTYDQAGNPTKITASDSSVTVTSGYYLDGLTRTASDGTNSNTYAYDGNGSLSLRTDQSATGGITGGGVKKTSYSYDDAGLPAKGASDVTATTTAWGYDHGGRDTSRTDSNSSGGVRSISQGFNQDNTVSTLSVSAGGNTIVGYSYSYDGNGQILTQNASSNASGGVSYGYSYTYDPTGNVTSWSGGTTPLQYVWDHNSNRTDTLANGVSAGHANYNSDNTLVSTNGGSGTPTVIYAYTNAGELNATKASNVTCSTTLYDAFGRTGQQATNADATNCGTTSANSTTTNSYDGLDRVQSAVTTGNEAGTTHSSYDGLTSKLVGQTGAVTGNGSNPTVLYQLNPNGAPVALTQTPAGGGSSTSTWLDKDTRGNVTALSDVGSGSASCSVEYDPFGGPAGAAPAGSSGNNVCLTGSSPTAIGSLGNNLWYQAGARSNTGGTYQDGARTYNPATASFTTADTYRAGTPAQDLSVGTDPLTANTYTYVNGNPINYNDPSGHRRLCDYEGRPTDDCSAQAAGSGSGGATPSFTPSQAQGIARALGALHGLDLSGLAGLSHLHFSALDFNMPDLSGLANLGPLNIPPGLANLYSSGGGGSDCPSFLSDVCGFGTWAKHTVVAGGKGLMGDVMYLSGGMDYAAGNHSGAADDVRIGNNLTNGYGPAVIKSFKECFWTGGGGNQACTTAMGAIGQLGLLAIPGADLADAATVGEDSVAAGADSGANAAQAASGLDRVGSALKNDPFHRSVSWVVDNPAAQEFGLTGGDGVARELYQLLGEVNGKSGVFEWIIDNAGNNPAITHQRFIPGGSITGYPNQVVQ